MATGIVGVLIGAAGLLLPAQTAMAAPGINKTINFQGKVVNANGTNVTNGSYPFSFKIYTASSGGSAIWTETKTLTVTDGVFQTNLGDSTSLPGSVDFNTNNIYLGITFNNDAAGEMTPRIQFTAAAYAFNSDALQGLHASDFAQLAANNTFTGANLFNPGSSGIALMVRAYSGGGQRSLEIRDSSNAVKGYFDASGSLNVGATLQPTADNTVDLGSSSLQFHSGYFGTSVIAPKVASGSGNLNLDSASNIIALDPTEATLQRTTTGTNTTYAVDLKDSAATTLTVTNSGTGAASLSVEAGISAGTTVSATGGFVANSLSGQTATCNVGEARTGATYTGGIITTAGACISVQAAGNYLVRVPTATTDNTVSPATSGVVGVTINATTVGTAAQALIVNQSQAGAATAEVNSTNTSGTQTNGLLINRNGASGTTTNGINVTNTAGTLTNGLTFTGAIGKEIKLQNGETIDNTTNGTINLQADSGIATLNLSGTAGIISTTAGALALQPSAGASVTGAVTKNAATGNEVGYDLAATINKATSGNYTGFKLNVTETSAPGASNLLADLQVGGASRFSVSSAGGFTAVGNGQVSGTLTVNSTAAIKGASALTLGQTGSATGAVLFQGSTAASGTITVIGQTNPAGATITLPDETGTVCLRSSVNCGFLVGAAGSYIINQTGVQTTSNFHVSDVGAADIAFVAPLVRTTDTSGTASGALVVRSGNVSGATANSGSVTIDAGSTPAGGFGGNVNLGAANAYNLTIGHNGASSSQKDLALVLQGTATRSSFVFSNSANTFTTTVTFDDPSSNISLAVPNAGTKFCTDSGNCGGANGYILNQSAGAQASAAFYIAGAGRSNTSFLAPLFDTATGVALGIGTNNATAINLNKSTAVTGALTQSGGVVTLGANGTSSLTTSSGDLTLTAAGILNLGTVGGSTIKIADNAVAHTITLGNDNTTTQGITLGSTSASSTTTIEGGSGGTSGTPSIAIGTANTAHYITVGTTNSSGIVKVQSGAFMALQTNSGLTVSSTTGSATAVQVQNASANNVFNLSNATTNLLKNSGFEGGSANWSTRGAPTSVAQDGAVSFEGAASLKAVVGATNNSGMQTTGGQAAFTTNILATTDYQVTFMARCSSTINTLTYGRQDNGSDINASTTANCTTGWQQYTFHYTTGGTINGTPNIYMHSGAATSVNLWIDAVSLVQTSTSAATPYAPGTIYLNGQVAGAAVFKNNTDSTNIFDVQNAAGASQFKVDSANGKAYIAGNLDTAGAAALALGGTNATSVTLGQASSSVNLTLQGSASTSWSATGASGSTTIGFASPTAAVVYNFATAAAGTYTICTTSASSCNTTYQAAGSYLLKNAINSSTASLTNPDTMLSLSNSGGSSTASILNLNNGVATGSTLYVQAAANPAANQALVFGKLTGTSGNLLDLWSGTAGSEATKFSVTAAGNVAAAGTLSSGTLTVTSASQNSITGGLSLSGGLSNNNAGITNTGSIASATTIGASGLITAGSNTTGIALTGTPATSATSSLLQLGATIAGGSANGTYLGVRQPVSGNGSVADFLNFQYDNGAGTTTSLKVDHNGAVTLGPSGSITYAASSTGGFDQSASSGNFATGSGTVSLNGNTTVTGAKTLTLNSLATTDNASYLCWNSVKAIANCSTTSSTSAFLQNGNSFGTTAILGTGDTQSLTFKTNNIQRITIDTSGSFTIANSGAGHTLSVAAASSAAGDALTVKAGSGGTGTFNGGNLVLQGGDKGTTGGTAGAVIVKPQTDTTVAFQVQNAAGTTNILTIDSTASASNMVIIGASSTNASTFASTGEVTFNGTARHSKNIHLTAEYAGAVLDAGGQATVSGTMTAGYDSAQRFGYYKWTTSLSSAQTYDVVVTIPLPDDWGAWNGNPQIKTYATSIAAGNTVQVINMTRTDGSADTTFAATPVNITPGSTSTWATYNSKGLDTTGYSAGGSMTIRLRMSSISSSDIRLGDITLPYLSRW